MSIFRIEGLTKADVELLDTMWAIDTTDDLAAFIAKQTPGVQKRIRVLLELIKLADTDQEDDVSMAQSMLRNIGVKC